MYNKNSKIIIAQNKNAIISDYQSGMTSREVGSKYNISNASVLKILKNNNIPSRSTKGLKLHTNRAHHSYWKIRRNILYIHKYLQRFLVLSKEKV